MAATQSTGSTQSASERIGALHARIVALVLAYASAAIDVILLELHDAQTADSFYDHMQSKVREGVRVSRYDPEASRLARLGQSVDIAGIVLTLVVSGVFAYVGLFIMSETEQSTDLGNDSNFTSANNDLTSGIETAFSMFEILFIALLLGAIIAVLLGIRGR